MCQFERSQEPRDEAILDRPAAQYARTDINDGLRWSDQANSSFAFLLGINGASPHSQYWIKWARAYKACCHKDAGNYHEYNTQRAGDDIHKVKYPDNNGD